MVLKKKTTMDTICHIRVNWEMSKPMEIKNGPRQVNVMVPILCNLVFGKVGKNVLMLSKKLMLSWDRNWEGLVLKFLEYLIISLWIHYLKRDFFVLCNLPCIYALLFSFSVSKMYYYRICMHYLLNIYYGYIYFCIAIILTISLQK